MGAKRIYDTKRMRIKNKLIEGAEHEKLAQNAMEAVTEFVSEAAPDRIDIGTIVNTRLHLEQLLRWNEKQGNTTKADLLRIEDDILLNLEEKHNEEAD